MPSRDYNFYRARREKFVRLWMAGATYDQIAEKCDLGKANIGAQATYLRKRGVELPYRPKASAAAITDAEVAALQEIVKEATKKAMQDALEAKDA